MSNESNEILNLAASFAGENADSTVLAAMCSAAAAEIESRLKEGISLTELGNTYTTAAGVLALSMYCAVSNPEQLRSFRAGDLSASYGGSGVSAEQLRALAEQMLGGALKDRGFGFVGVQG